MEVLRISEIFHSIQGEGRRAGERCAFVRLHGCGLRCTWCDTPYALDHSQGGRLAAPHEIVDEVASMNCRFVEFTGGEPLEQEACLPLMTQLCDLGYIVAVETGGHVDIRSVDPRVSVIMDVKCPTSGMQKKNRLGNIGYLKPGDEVKFVLQNRADYDWAKDFIAEHADELSEQLLLFSPVYGALDNKQLAEWILHDELPVRMQLQLHKYIWHPEARGV